MKRIRITLKNYRGFSDEEPLRFEIGPQCITAFVGKNNSGKSAAKLFFFEFRPLFEKFKNVNPGISPSLAQVLRPGFRMPVEYRKVVDPEEVFNNSNTRPLTIELEIAQPESKLNPPPWDCLTKLVATCERARRNEFEFAAYGRDLITKLTVPSQNALNSGRTKSWAFSQGEIDHSDFSDAMALLAGARYYGPFRNVINEGAGDHFDLKVGAAFVDLWKEWKTGGMKERTRAIDKVTEDIRSLFEFDRLEINAADSLKTLVLGINGQSYRLGELGSGLAQFIMVLGNAATTRPALILLDEPETNLHPTLQIDFLLTLAQYAEHGVIFSTHSIGLARSVGDAIYSFQRQGNKTIVRPFEATPNYLQFVGELSFSAFKDLGSDKILLVEGVNDVKAVQQLLRLYKKEHTAVILPLGGDEFATGGRVAELNELNRISENIFALVDSERSVEDGPPAPKRAAFAETCRQCGFKLCITKRRAIENYFADSAIKAALGDAYSSLGPFEDLRASRRPWSKRENWKIARQMQVEDLSGTDLGGFLEGL